MTAVPLSTEDVRFYATTNQSANHSLSVSEMEAGFDAWIAKVKEDAASEALGKAISTLDFHAARAANEAGSDPYRIGRGDGLEFGATLMNRMKNQASPIELLRGE